MKLCSQLESSYNCGVWLFFLILNINLTHKILSHDNPFGKTNNFHQTNFFVIQCLIRGITHYEKSFVNSIIEVTYFLILLWFLIMNLPQESHLNWKLCTTLWYYYDILELFSYYIEYNQAMKIKTFIRVSTFSHSNHIIDLRGCLKIAQTQFFQWLCWKNKPKKVFGLQVQCRGWDIFKIL